MEALLEKKPENSRWLPRPVYRVAFCNVLIPCYYTIQSDRDSLTGSQTGFILAINNVGTESDSYNITVTSSSNHYHGNFNSAILKKENGQRLKLPPAGKLIQGERIEVLVKSPQQPRF